VFFTATEKLAAPETASICVVSVNVSRPKKEATDLLPVARI
jgi:hypothetical protein